MLHYLISACFENDFCRQSNLLFDYLKLFDQSKINIDKDLNVTGLDDFAKFKKDNPELFEEEDKKDNPGVDQRKPGTTKSKGNLVDELKELKTRAQQTQTAADLAAYNRKYRECREKKLI